MVGRPPVIHPVPRMRPKPCAWARPSPHPPAARPAARSPACIDASRINAARNIAFCCSTRCPHCILLQHTARFSNSTKQATCVPSCQASCYLNPICSQHCLLLQYTARFSAEKLKKHIHRLGGGKFGIKWYNMRLAPEAVSGQLDPVCGWCNDTLSTLPRQRGWHQVVQHAPGARGGLRCGGLWGS